MLAEPHQATAGEDGWPGVIALVRPTQDVIPQRPGKGHGLLGLIFTTSSVSLKGGGHLLNSHFLTIHYGAGIPSLVSSLS